MKDKNLTTDYYTTNSYNFQHGTIQFTKCEGCEEYCEILYDQHHDQYFSVNCGTVIMENNCYLIDNNINYTYNTTTKKERKHKKP